MNQRSFLLLFFSAGLVLMGCSKDPISDLSLEDTQVFITNRAKGTDFKQFETFSIVDSVTLIQNSGSGKILQDPDKEMFKNIIARMIQLGYRQVLPTEKPDVGINVTLNNRRYDYIVSQPIGSYWGGYYGGWGYGYPAYYNSYVQVSELFWVIDMLDFKHADPVNQKVNVVWNAQIRGEGLYDDGLETKMVDGIFNQSPYLKVK